MVRYRVLRRKDVPEVQSVALKAWKFAYRRYGLSLKLIEKFVLERYSTDSFEKTVSHRSRREKPSFTSRPRKERSSATPTRVQESGDGNSTESTYYLNT